MHQAIALTVLIALTLVFRDRAMAEATSEGNWGGAIGVLMAAVFMFYLVQALLFFGRRLFGGKPVSTFTQSLLNYVSVGLALIVVLASRLPAGA